jgi:hypothetical protein
MNGLQVHLKRTFFTLLTLLLAVAGTVGSSTQAPKASAAASAKAYVYYVSEDVLYRVSSDGSETLTIAENFDGSDLVSTGKYLYFSHENTPGLQRLSLADPDALITSFADDRNILKYLLDGDFFYFLDDTGSIYRTAANAEDDSQLKLIADNADVNFPSFTVLNGRIYYNALKNKSVTWVASRPRDGSGAVQWIASGAIQADPFFHPYSSTLNLMVDTVPTETQYSLNSMVLYTMPLSGGNPKAANAKSPLDVNSVYSGSWGNNYFLYNKGIKLNAEGDSNFATGKGYLIDKNGKSLQLNQTGVLGISELSNTKLAYVDAKGKVYISTIANGKITGTKALPLSNAINMTTLKYGTTYSTIIFTTTDAYLLKADSTLTKMAGVEYDYSVFLDDIPGIYFINSGDNDCLYGFSNDGKTKIKLSNGPVTSIALLSSN